MSGCGTTNPERSSEVFYIGGVPDQDTSVLIRRFDGLATYLSNILGINVKYRSSIDYAAVVVGFKKGHIHMGWFGGLTGVQARRAVPGAQAIAQRPKDAKFVTVFIVQKNIPAQTLSDLKGLTFTFGSESSTSGHLMPRHFLLLSNVNPDKDFNGLANFSGSHDTTWKLVESGTYQGGALSESVWSKAVRNREVDLGKVRVLAVTQPYYDYNWTLRPNLDEVFGTDFTRRVTDALIQMGNNIEHRELLATFQTDHFIETNNENYRIIEQIAQDLGMVENR